MNQSQVIADFKRRYEHTYVFVAFPESQKEGLFRVDSVEETDSTVGIICLSSDEYGKIRLNFATDHEIKFKFPKVGVFQNGKEAFYFRRVPAKQYARGICAGNSEMQAVTYGIYRQMKELTWETVNNAFIGHVYSVREALEMLKSMKYKSVALESNFSLCQSLTEQKGYLMLHFDIPVAWLDIDGKLSLILEDSYTLGLNQVLNHG